MAKFKFLAALVIGLSFSMPVAAKLYKWMDDRGVTHYGETIPPEYAHKDRAELNQSGRVIKTESPLTSEERSAKKLADAKKLEEEKGKLAQQRYDLTLTNTYSNVKEIDLASSRSLQQVDARINSSNSQLQMISATLLGLQTEADGYNKANKPIPVSLQEDLQETQARLDKLQFALDQLKSERVSVGARYDADKLRYQALTGK